MGTASSRLQHCHTRPLINLSPNPQKASWLLSTASSPGKIEQGAEIQAGCGTATALLSTPHQACSWRPPEFLPKGQSNNFISKSLPLYHSACLKCSDTFPMPGYFKKLLKRKTKPSPGPGVEKLVSVLKKINNSL